VGPSIDQSIDGLTGPRAHTVINNKKVIIIKILKGLCHKKILTLEKQFFLKKLKGLKDL
jgi:hypothetical protein